MTASATTWGIIIVAILASGGFSFLEWRRADRRHLAARLAATLIAVAALALLGLRPAWQHAPDAAAANLRASLWTPLTAPAASAPSPGTPLRFALPDAVRFDPAATVIPDAAFLRRHYPALGTLRIIGDGLDSSELPSLRGLRIEFTPPQNVTTPGIGFLRCPRELTLGDPLTIQGQVCGVPPGTAATLILEAPDGALTRATTDPADAAGTARFEIRAAPLPATGRFLWHLRTPELPGYPSADIPLGIVVRPPDLPRLLVLESAPRFDTAALRRWFETAGGTLVTRTLVGQERYRVASSVRSSPPPSFNTLDTPLLAGYDLLLADAGSLLALTPAERGTLLAAVADTGLGVLALPDDTLPPPPAGANPLLPWALAPLAADTPGSDRPARVQWDAQAAPTEEPVPAAPFEILPDGSAGQRLLVRDRQGHTLAATRAHGRGQIALTLLRDTTRWQRENVPAAFAAYWSFLFSRIARPADGGRWSLADGDAGPVFVDHPLDLLWSGPASTAAARPPPGSATVDGSTTLALAPDPAEPTRWRGTFWPRHSGWHHVFFSPDGPALDFHVSTAAAWPSLDAARRRTATARFAEGSTSSAPSAALPVREEIPPGWFAAIFLGAAAYLWIERRFQSA